MNPISQYVCDFHGSDCPEYGHENEKTPKHCSHCGKTVTPGQAEIVDLSYKNENLHAFWLLCHSCVSNLKTNKVTIVKREQK